MTEIKKTPAELDIELDVMDYDSLFNDLRAGLVHGLDHSDCVLQDVQI